VRAPAKPAIRSATIASGTVLAVARTGV